MAGAEQGAGGCRVVTRTLAPEPGSCGSLAAPAAWEKQVGDFIFSCKPLTQSRLEKGDACLGRTRLRPRSSGTAGERPPAPWVPGQLQPGHRRPTFLWKPYLEVCLWTDGHYTAFSAGMQRTPSVTRQGRRAAKSARVPLVAQQRARVRVPADTSGRGLCSDVLTPEQIAVSRGAMLTALLGFLSPGDDSGNQRGTG